MLQQEQIENIKTKLISQLEATNLPDKEEIKNNIWAMDPEQLEQFLIQNNLIKTQQNQESRQEQQCIFCSIISGSINSYKIDENSDAVAVLEINPVSKGHVLIIPKEHLDKPSKAIQNFAEEISKKLKTKLKPKNIIIAKVSLFGHEIFNIIPIYKDENINSKRQQAKPEELEKLQKLLEKKQKTKTEKIKKLKIEKLSEEKAEKLWLPRRVP